MTEQLKTWVDPYELARQVGEWEIDQIVEFVKNIDRYRCEEAVSSPLRDYFTEVMIAEERPDPPEEIKWPMTMDDPARAIHETIERGQCEANNPLNCFSVNHRAILSVIEHYQTWLKHRGVDVVGQLSRLGDS
jgi:hypothetical protein